MTVPLEETARKPGKAFQVVARTLGLCLLYTVAFIVIAAALKAQQDPDGVARLSFAYKVF